MAERGGDAAIASLGVHRIPIPIPFPQAGGPVNAIAVEEEGGGVALFDTGLCTDEAMAAFHMGLAGAGFRVEDIRRIFITHAHIDHYGYAQRLRAIAGAEVFVHPRDREKILRPAYGGDLRPLYTDYLLRCGVSPSSIEEILLTATFQETFGDRLEEPLGTLAEGQRLRFARCDARILEMPGHTPGLVCALLTAHSGDPARRGVLLANDHLLEKVSPNPLLEILPDGTRFPALPTYFESLAKARALELDWVVPGHGPCFQGHRALIDGLRTFYDKRQNKLLANIPREGATPVDLVFSIFPKATPLDTYLMIGEILGNLDRMEAEGRVGVTEKGGILRYLRR